MNEDVILLLIVIEARQIENAILRKIIYSMMMNRARKKQLC